MLPETDQYVELLDQRVSALRQLARQLVDCRPAFVAMDLDGIYRHVGEQEASCRRIRAIDSALRAAAQVRRRASAIRESAELESGIRIEQLKQDLGEAQAEVRQLNRVHAAMLRRSSRTLAMLTNLLGNYAMTYGPPERHGSHG